MNRPLVEGNSEIFIRFNEAITILRKLSKTKELSFLSLVSSQKPFGLRTYVQGERFQHANSVKLYANRNVSKEAGYIALEEIEVNRQWIKHDKVYISSAYGERGEFPYLVLGKPFLGEPNSCCTETFLLIGPFKCKQIAKNVISYIQTRFFRFLVLQLKSTQHAAKNVYSLVPIQDFSEPWTDEKLYAKYGLTDAEIAFIESMIRPMELGGENDND
jgi:site-specific DNA-methyltransferase (adenine-specific)